MNILIFPPYQGCEPIYTQLTENGHQVFVGQRRDDTAQFAAMDVIIDAAFSGSFLSVGDTPLLFHEPVNTFAQLFDIPKKAARFCSWPGFWERKIWEVSVAGTWSSARIIFEQLIGLEVKTVKDTTGLIAPRILCNLIVEALHTLEANTATAVDIDKAMRLGTNYPKGPLEWAAAIGMQPISRLLLALAVEHPMYALPPTWETMLDRICNTHA